MYLKGRPITMFLPKEQVDGYCLEARAELPGNKLKLDWVYPFIEARRGSATEWILWRKSAEKQSSEQSESRLVRDVV